MSYSLRKIYISFDEEVTELNRIILTLVATPESIERDTHIEGCFIRLVVCWEHFVEEYFLRCLCGAKTRGKYVIKPQIALITTTNEAFKRIHRNREDRHKAYIDWLNPTVVQRRIDESFRSNSRVQKICESPDMLDDLRIVRNAIAHRSESAIHKFRNLVKVKMGYLGAIDPTMSALLLQKNKSSLELIFTIYTNYFRGLANRLTK